MTICAWCEADHAGVCPRVAAIEFQDDGVTVKMVHFFPPAAPAVLQVPEDDASYRKRLARVIGRESVNTSRCETDTGSNLDELGGFYDTPRGMMAEPK